MPSKESQIISHCTIFKPQKNALSIWDNFPNHTILDFLHKLHRKEEPVNIFAPQEPYFFGTNRFTDEELNSENWNSTPVNIIFGHDPQSEDLDEYMLKNDRFEFLKPIRHYFPLYFLYYTFSESMGADERNPKYTQYHWTYYARATRRHRIPFLNEAAKLGILYKNIYSFQNNGKETLDIVRELEQVFNYKVDSFNLKTHRYEADLETGGTPYSDNNTDQAFYHSSIHIAGETAHEVTFFTEKTWNPILHGKPVIVHGAKNSNKHLEHYGFKLYDNVIDYSFDKIDNMFERTEMLAAELKRVGEKYTPQVLTKMTLEIADYNKHNALRIIKERRHIPEIFKEWLSIYDSNEHARRTWLDFWYKCRKKINTDSRKTQ